MPGEVGAGRSRRSSANRGENTNNGERIRVVVRVRPQNEAEKAAAYRNVIEVVGEEMLVFDPQENGSPSYYHGKARRQRDISKRACRDMKFVFDRVFGNEDTTTHVYENTTKAILQGLLEGFNCSVFAYGATGAGKTHTMLGTQQDPGVIFLTMMDLYRSMDQLKEEKTCDIAVSYLEVYNEQIRDLLIPGNFLPVREDPGRGVVIAGLSLHKPHSAEELMHMLRVGNSNRTQHPTDANAESSRSHAVFQVYVRQRDRTANTSAEWNVAKMSLIDLAGSERATVTKNRGARFREGANINRSLLALGNCINALAEGKSKGFVPYRNSKLTRLLKDSLGGNCRTVMIAAVSPSAMSYEDTYNTLKYADRAKNIKVGLKKNVLSVDLHVSRYVAVIEELRKEVAELKERLSVGEHPGSTAVLTVQRETGDGRSVHERLSASLDGVFRGRIEIRKEMLELESSERDLAYKIYRKELMMARISLFAQGHTDAQKCVTRFIESAARRKANIEKRRLGMQSRMNDNAIWLQQVMEEVEQSRPHNPLAELLDANIRMRHLEVELRDVRRQAKYLKRLSRAQEREAQSMEKINTVLLQTVCNQYRLIKAHGIAGHQEVSQYEMVQQMVSQNVERNVVWADQSVCPDDALSTTIPITPGPAETAGGEFSVSSLLDFPILSCVPITPKRSGPPTGIRGDQPQSTPTSARRRRRTPKKPYDGRGGCRIPTPNKNSSNFPPCSDSKPSINNLPAGPDSLPAGALKAEGPALAKNLYHKGVFSQERIKEEVREDDGVFPLQPTPPATAATSRLPSVGLEPPTAPGPQVTVHAPPPRLDLEDKAAGPASQQPRTETTTHHTTSTTHLPRPDTTSHQPRPQTTSHLKHPTTTTQLNLQHPKDTSLHHTSSTLLPKPHLPTGLGSTYNVAMKSDDGDSNQGKPGLNSTYTENHNQTVSLSPPAPDQTHILNNRTVRLSPPAPDQTHVLNNQTVSLSPPAPTAPDQTRVLNKVHFSTSGLPLPVVSDNTPRSPVLSHPTPTLPQTPTLASHSLPTPPSPTLQHASVNMTSTVTKTVPLKGDGGGASRLNSGTITKGKASHAGGATVTKQIHVDKENTVTPPLLPPVVRSINFGGVCQSPAAGGLSFAEVLKSPAPSQFQRLRDPGVVRSPLASRENLPNAGSGSHIGRPSLSGLFGKSGQRGKSNRLVRHHSIHGRPTHPGTDTLRKLGLPSVLERRGSGGTPGYMKNTKASSRRYKNHRSQKMPEKSEKSRILPKSKYRPKSITSEEGSQPFPRRIFQNDENVRPGPKRGMGRSKSTVSLSSRTAGPR